MTINAKPLSFSCFTEASVSRIEATRMDPNESLGLFTCEHAAIVDLKQKNAPVLVVRRVFPEFYVLVRYSQINGVTVASVLNEDRSWSHDLFHDHALRLNDLVGQTLLEWFVNTAVHEDVIEEVDGDLGHDLRRRTARRSPSGQSRELEVELRINRDEHAMMKTVRTRRMKTHKFNRDIEYWYDRSVRVWYCQFTPEAESEIENLDPYYFVPLRETRSGLTKSDIWKHAKT